MPTLAELIKQFEDPGETAAAGDGHRDLEAELNAGLETGPYTKTASAGGQAMKSLQEIYLSMTQLDKTASAVSTSSLADEELSDEELVEAAEKLASAEAEAQLAEEDPDDGDGEPLSDHLLKVAMEYDAAGRIIARGYADEWNKLAAQMQAPFNRSTERESAAKTPALGNRGLPTMETNYAGSPNNDQPIEFKGGKEVYRNSLQTAKKIKAGVTGDDPEAAAISIGGGSPQGFATVRDLGA